MYCDNILGTYFQVILPQPNMYSFVVIVIITSLSFNFGIRVSNSYLIYLWDFISVKLKLPPFFSIHIYCDLQSIIGFMLIGGIWLPEGINKQNKLF